MNEQKVSKENCIDDFIAAIKSEVAKQYWYEQFRAEQNQVFTEDDMRAAFYAIQNAKDNEEVEPEFYSWLQKQTKIIPEQKQITDEEIKALAEKEYPFDNMCSSQVKRAYIKGFKAALNKQST